MIDNKDKNDIVPAGSKKLKVYSSELIQRGLVLAKNIKKGKEPIGKLKWKIKANKVYFLEVTDETICYIHESEEQNEMYISAINIRNGQEKWRIAVNREYDTIDNWLEITNGVIYYIIDFYDWKHGTRSITLVAANIQNGESILGWDIDYCAHIKVFKNCVILENSKRNLISVDIQSKNLKWKLKREGSVWGEIFTTEKTMFVFWEYGKILLAVNIDTGKEIWSLTIDDQALHQTPVIVNEILCFGGKNGDFYGIDTRSGQFKWKVEIEKEIIPLFSLNEIVYCGRYKEITEDIGKININYYFEYLYAINSITGKEKWKFKINGYMFNSVIISQKVIYCGTFNGYIYAIDAISGVEIWRIKIDDDLNCSPKLYEGIIYFISEKGYIYVIDTKTGQEKWRFKSEGKITSEIKVCNGIICFGSDAGYLYAIE